MKTHLVFYPSGPVFRREMRRRQPSDFIYKQTRLGGQTVERERRVYRIGRRKRGYWRRAIDNGEGTVSGGLEVHVRCSRMEAPKMWIIQEEDDSVFMVKDGTRGGDLVGGGVMGGTGEGYWGKDAPAVENENPLGILPFRPGVQKGDEKKTTQ
ncbi:hypothetical protein U1Q18_036590 [Sarracenia purpurea var. burkii]